MKDLNTLFKLNYFFYSFNKNLTNFLHFLDSEPYTNITMKSCMHINHMMQFNTSSSHALMRAYSIQLPKIFQNISSSSTKVAYPIKEYAIFGGWCDIIEILSSFEKHKMREGWIIIRTQWVNNLLKYVNTKTLIT